jgi:hypothetical protein
MADLLSSGALLATVLSLFYTLWYPEIRLALDTLKPKNHLADSNKDIALLTATIKQRVLPLLVASAATLIALLPDAVGVLVRSARAWSIGHRAYDAVSMLYLMMTAMMAALVMHVCALFAACRALLKRLRHETP